MPTGEETTLTIQDSSEPQIFDNEPIITEEAPEQPTITEDKAPEVDYKVLYEKAQAEHQALQEQLQPFQEYQRHLEEQQLAELEQSLFGELFTGGETEESSAKPKVAPQQKEAVQNLLRAGMQYVQNREVIESNLLAGAAVNYAEEVLGANATISQMKEVARELAALKDKRLMQLAIPVLKDKYRTQAAEKRISTGADTVQTATNQGGATLSFDVLERAFAAGTLSPEKEAMYMQMRAQKGL